MKQLILLVMLTVPVIGWGQVPNIQQESVQSLMVWTPLTKVNSAFGTGFVIKSKTRYYLITNWHIVTHRNAWDNSWIDSTHVTPDQINIMHNDRKGLGHFTMRTEKLLNKDKKPLYHTFKSGKSTVDVVAIPLNDTIGLNLFPVNYSLTYDELNITPAETVFVVGFPKMVRFSDGTEKNDEFLPVWKSGTIASEPEIDEGGKPIIWVDLQGFGGMSGSPVYYISDNVKRKNGTTTFTPYKATYFMGVFSHSNPTINLGALWKSTFLKKEFDRLP